MRALGGALLRAAVALALALALARVALPLVALVLRVAPATFLARLAAPDVIQALVRAGFEAVSPAKP